LLENGCFMNDVIQIRHRTRMGTLAQLDTTAIGIPPGSCHQTWNPNPMSPILAHVGMYSLTAATVAPCWCGGLKITHSRVWPPVAGHVKVCTHAYCSLPVCSWPRAVMVLIAAPAMKSSAEFADTSAMHMHSLQASLALTSLAIAIRAWLPQMAHAALPSGLGSRKWRAPRNRRHEPR
jgi:hypothetical protein